MTHTRFVILRVAVTHDPDFDPDVLCEEVVFAEAASPDGAIAGHEVLGVFSLPGGGGDEEGEASTRYIVLRVDVDTPGPDPDDFCHTISVFHDAEEGIVEGSEVVAVFPPSHRRDPSDASVSTPAAPVPPATPGAASGAVRREQEEVNALVRAKEWVKVANHPYFMHVANPQQLTAVIRKLQAATGALPPGDDREDHEFAVAVLRSLLNKRTAVEAGPTRPGQKPTTGGDPRPTPAGTQPAAHLAVPPLPPAAPASPPAPRDAANKARVEALAAHWNARNRPGGSPATPIPPTPAACPPPATRPTAPPTYYDCPICGQAVADDSYSPGKSVGCPQCGNEFAAATGLNRRTTPQPVETRGFLGQLLWGRTVQTPLRKKLISTIRLYESIASSAAAAGNFEQAHFYQMRATDARRHLENT